jgi:hypothetical protein
MGSMNPSGRRRVWTVAALGLALAACGGASQGSPLDLKTPGAKTGDPSAAAPNLAVTPAPGSPTPTPTATPSPAPKPAVRPVTRDETRIIGGWSDALRHSHVAAASRYFSIPSVVENDDTPMPLVSRGEVQGFLKTLPCGAKLVKTRRSTETTEPYVIGTFVLTERPGQKCDGPGNAAEVAFLIRNHRIIHWVRLADPQSNTVPTPTPTAVDPLSL